MLELMRRLTLNYLDLRRNFSLPDVCRQQMEFLRFAAVHCLPVRSRRWRRRQAEAEGCPGEKTLFYADGYRDDRSRYYEPARYLTKEFWLWLFRQSMDGAGESGDRTGGAKADGRALVAERLLASPWFQGSGAEKAEALEREFPEEWYDCWMEEQVRGLRRFMEQTGDPGGPRRFCLLLSALQLAEQDADRLRALPPPPERRQTGKRTQAGKPAAEAALPLVVQEGAAVLEAGKTYRLVRYEGKTGVMEGIRTVRLDVGTAPNAYLTARIQLYTPRGEPVGAALDVEQGASLYATMDGGRLIRFLPAVSRCGGRALGRRTSRDWALYRTAGEGRLVKVISGADGQRISSFALDPTAASVSFLYLEDGKLCSDCYEKCQDDYELKAGLLEVKYGQYAEVAFTQEGQYLLLGTDGVIRSNDPTWDGKRAVALGEPRGGALPTFLSAERGGTRRSGRE